MVAIKAHQANAFVKTIPSDIRALLFFGPDAGMVMERAKVAAQHFCADNAELIRLDENDVAEEPERFAIELQTVSMFGETRVVRAPVTTKLSPALVEEVLDSGLNGTALVLEGGDLKPANKIRKAFESSKIAAAVACYPDAARDLDGLIGDVLGAANLSINRDTKSHLRSRLGADRALSRNELEKLVLYLGPDASQVEMDDVDAVIGDSSELVLDRISLAATGGRVKSASQDFDRALASGQAIQTIMLALQRHLLRMHRVKSAMEGGKNTDAALRSLRPPLHFKIKDEFVEQCRNWRMGKLNDAIVRTQDAIRRCREQSSLEQAHAERLLLEISALAK